jgi:hypothetical protein
MIKVLPPPSEAEEYRNTAEILRDLAAQTRFDKTRNELFILPTISIGWLPSPSINLKLGFKRFAHYLMMARLELALTVGWSPRKYWVSRLPASYMRSANLRRLGSEVGLRVHPSGAARGCKIVAY